jgi:hypothetical protein
MEEQIISLIGSLGFPIAVCIYLLVERGKTMKELTRAINELCLIIKTRIK